MMEISKRFRFEACHSLPHLPENHKCRKLHGHSYEIVVHVQGEVDEAMGWFIDYADISEAIAPIIAHKLDHQNLNETLGFKTTAENIAVWLYGSLKKKINVSCIEVRETPTSNVVYRP